MNEALAPAALLKLPDGEAKRFSFQPHGSLALTVGSTSLQVWDWRNEVVLPWSEALADVVDANWSPDGRQLAVGFGNGDVRLFNSMSGMVSRSFRHSERVEVVEWSPEGTRLAVGGMRVQIWNVAAEPVREADWPHPKKVFALTFNRAATRLVTSSEDGFARVFAVGDVSLPATLYPPVEHVPNYITSLGNAVLFDEDRRLATLGRSSRDLVLRDAASGQPVVPNWTVSDPLVNRCLAVSPDGRWVAAGGFRSGFLLGADGQTVELKHGNQVDSVRFTSDGQSLVTTCWDGTARWWPLHFGESSSPTVGEPTTFPQMATAATCDISADDSWLAIIDKHQVVIWERPQPQARVGQISWFGVTWKPRTSFDGRLVTPGRWHESPFGTLGLPPRGNELVVAQMENGHPAGPPIKLKGLLFDSCICSDNRSVAAVTVSGTSGVLSVYDIASGTSVIPSRALPDLPLSVDARPEQPQVAVLCRNGTLLVIDTKEGRARLALSHDGWSGERPTSRVAYSPDARRR